ncbi:MAG: glycosyltransferase [Acidimicrobiales bacterium]
MRRRLRTFLSIGVLTTAIDLALFLGLEGRAGAVPADVVSLSVAAVFSYLANRFATFGNDRQSRWVRHPMTFVSMATIAGALDVMIVSFLTWAGAAPWPTKLVAIVFAAGARWLTYRWVLFTEIRQTLGERVSQAAAPGEVRLSVVVPAYNEGHRIADTVNELRSTIGVEVGDDLEILVVDDGSPDDTAEQARAAGATVVVLDPNQGKGAAVRAGMMAATGRSRVFTDADLAYPPSAVLDIMNELESGWDIVVGSRQHEETTTLVRARRIRQLGGRVINAITHLVLLGHFRDTQCGIKGFRSDVAQSMFRRCRIDRFGFDVELFCIAELDGRSLHEIPVSVRNTETSSVRLVRDTVLLTIDLIRIRRWAGEGVYRRPT